MNVGIWNVEQDWGLPSMSGTQSKPRKKRERTNDEPEKD